MKPRILIVDDEEGIRESLRLILEQNYELLLATTGDECIDCIKNTTDVNLVLLDIKMPKIDGIQILKQLKQINPNIKVIMVTGYKSVETATEAIKAGAADYIVKPFNSANILETINKILI